MVLYILAWAPVSIWTLGTSLLGRCDSDGHCFDPSLYLLLIFGPPAALILLGWFLHKYVMKVRD